MPRKRIKVVERKLGRERAYGQAWQGENLVEIDPRQKSREYMDTLIHEVLHIQLPDMSEEEVGETAAAITAALWKKNFRRVRE